MMNGRTRTMLLLNFLLFILLASTLPQPIRTLAAQVTAEPPQSVYTNYTCTTTCLRAEGNDVEELETFLASHEVVTLRMFLSNFGPPDVVKIYNIENARIMSFYYIKALVRIDFEARTWPLRDNISLICPYLSLYEAFRVHDTSHYFSSATFDSHIAPENILWGRVIPQDIWTPWFNDRIEVNCKIALRTIDRSLYPEGNHTTSLFIEDHCADNCWFSLASGGPSKTTSVELLLQYLHPILYGYVCQQTANG
jgi:hypothetical protein